MLGHHTIASGTCSTSSATAPADTTPTNDDAAQRQGHLHDGSLVVLVQTPEPLTQAADLAREVFTPPAAAVDPAPRTPLQAIKGCEDFRQLMSRLAQHTAQIEQQASYLASRPGDRYNGLRPESRTAWPRQQHWYQGTWLNGNTVSVQGKPIAVATQHPLPGESLIAFLKQLLCDHPPLIVVLGSDAEIANPQERMPDYFRPSAARADLRYIPPEVRHMLPADEPGLLGSYLAHGGMYCWESWLIEVQAIEPMSPLTESGLDSISTGVIRVKEGSANPTRELEPRSHDVEVVHLRQTGKNGIMSSAELAWLGARIRAARWSASLLPIVHCNSGAGRSAMVIAATVLDDPSSSASVETIVRDIRRTRHARALGSEDQIACLALFARERGKPLLGVTPAVPLQRDPEPDPLTLARESAMKAWRTR